MKNDHDMSNVGFQVEFCEKTGKPILDHDKVFLNILAKIVRDTILASTPTWKDVKKEDIELILNRMEVKFDYPRSDALFMDSIEQYMMAYLRDWHNMMQNHFTKLGGNLEIGEVMSPIDYFESYHHKPSGWRNKYIQEKHSKLRDGVSSVESVVGPEQVDEFQIMSKALGTRSRWQKGLGALPRLKSIGGQRATSMGQQLAEKDAEHARRIDETQQQRAKKEAENQCRLKETQQQLNEQNWILQTLIAKLGIEMPPPPPLEL
ncbi:hypothetical protein PanWU01x14_002490 [Parasponia andersonii]|uniref:Transposase, Ptta/En/Spm, plant n=1 Tax=Parasponia andersonii TaxID=3476 RepID=A0A2P5E577_PARAD|nr:hypothetical protein PanWU01x14_002490 [Parasponia andersonii]